jgi:hypothetical protein
MGTQFSDIYTDWHDASNVPEIRVGGLILEKFGFSYGTPIMISIEQGRIIITPIQKEGLL